MESERPEKGTARFSVTCNNFSFYDPSAFIRFSFRGVPKNSVSPSNGERVQSTASMADFFNNKNAFIINIQMHKMKAL